MSAKACISQLARASPAPFRDAQEGTKSTNVCDNRASYCKKPPNDQAEEAGTSRKIRIFSVRTSNFLPEGGFEHRICRASSSLEALESRSGTVEQLPPKRNESPYAACLYGSLARQHEVPQRVDTQLARLLEEVARVVGRIAAIDNQRYRVFANENTGFFYFFEVIEDIQVARQLFNAVFDWSEKRGLSKIVGPKGLAQGDGLGMLVEGFQYKPAIGIPYNPRYYQDFALDSGFEKDLDYLSGHLKTDYQVPERVHQISKRVQEKRGFKVVEFNDKKEMAEWIPRIKDVFNQSFGSVPGFSPITEDEVFLIANRILAVAHPKLIKLICKHDELVGFLFAFPDVSGALQRAKGKLQPISLIDLLLEMKRTNKVSVNGVGILPKHQGHGGNAILYAEMGHTLFMFDQFEHIEMTQVAETAKEMRSDLKNLNGVEYKNHRVYRKSI